MTLEPCSRYVDSSTSVVSLFSWESSLSCVSFPLFFLGSRSDVRGVLHNSVGYPVISHLTALKISFNDGFNYGGSNTSGVVRPFDMPSCPLEHL